MGKLWDKQHSGNGRRMSPKRVLALSFLSVLLRLAVDLVHGCPFCSRCKPAQLFAHGVTASAVPGRCTPCRHASAAASLSNSRIVIVRLRGLNMLLALKRYKLLKRSWVLLRKMQKQQLGHCLLQTHEFHLDTMFTNWPSASWGPTQMRLKLVGTNNTPGEPLVPSTELVSVCPAILCHFHVATLQLITH